MKKRLGLACLAVLLASGCGYHVAGHADLLPKTIKTIAVPAFGNATTRYQLARLLPEDITREFLSRTRYKVVGNPAEADAVLNGAILNAVAYPTTIDPTSGRANAVQVIVTLQLTLTDRSTGKALFSRPAADYRQVYQISLDPKKYFDESSTAMIRLSQDVARDVVSSILEQF
jgi:outer membrane lipopolysaccharide assembly protein LptE/RlpB